MSKKNVICNVIFGVVLITAFFVVLKINQNTHLYHDEFVYSAVYGTERKIQSISDIFTSINNIYFKHNGRIVTHFILTIFLQLGSTIRQVINAIMFVLLLFELMRFSTKKDTDMVLKILIMCMIFPLLWCTIPAFGETIIWPAGSINYLWTTVRFTRIYLLD